ncbi:hypothetical protein [Pyrodictium delaneyi]|nr:hypothetical protein [Pyrodictium delaneyi]
MGLFWGFGGLVWLFLGLLVAFFVYSDASGRYPRGSLAPLAWAVGVVFGGLLVLLIYLVVRPSGERREEMEEKGEGRG